MNLTEFLSHFAHVRPHGPNHWTAQCPGHEDRSCDTLDLRESDDGKHLVYCRAGCETDRVLDAVGLTLRDLFQERPPMSPVIPLYAERVKREFWALLNQRERLYGPYHRVWAVSQEIRLLRQAAELARMAGAEWGDTEEGWDYLEAAANLERRASVLEVDQDAALMDLRRG